MKKEIEIQEGYEAKIEGNKVVIVPKESEDGRIMKDIITYLSNELHNIKQLTLRTNEFEAWIAYLERQKERKPVRDIEHLKSLMLQYLQAASNRKNDTAIQSDTDLWARKIIAYVCGKDDEHAVDDENAVWTSYDDEMFGKCIAHMTRRTPVPGKGCLLGDIKVEQDKDCVDWLVNVKFRQTWKPTEEQIRAVIEIINETPRSVRDWRRDALKQLLEQLEKL